MTAPVEHVCGVEREQSDSGAEWWRATCSCGFKSARYAIRATAADKAAAHSEIVRLGMWGGDAA